MSDVFVAAEEGLLQFGEALEQHATVELDVEFTDGYPDRRHDAEIQLTLIATLTHNVEGWKPTTETMIRLNEYNVRDLIERLQKLEEEFDDD